MGKSLSQKTKKNYALADAMLCVDGCKALHNNQHALTAQYLPT